MKIDEALICKACRAVLGKDCISCTDCGAPTAVNAVPVKTFVEHFYAEEKK